MSATLILGGVRSGKSRLAERLAHQSGREVIYVATAQARDDLELRSRIEAHRARRPAHWHSVEAPLHLAEALRAHDGPERCLLVDCLTLWLTNLLCADDEAQLARECEALVEGLSSSLQADVVLVANETSLGVVPLGVLTRRFLDLAGVLHQRLAAHCERVLITVAGLPLALKGAPPT